MATVAIQDRYFSGRERSAALVAATEHGTHACVLGSYLAGSLAVGLGHSSSDIDVYVLVGAFSLRPGRSRRIGEYRVEVKEITVAEVEDLVCLGASYYARTNDRSQTNMPDTKLKRLVDLYVGQELQACEMLGRARAAVSRQALRQLLMSRNAIVAAGWADDAGGSAHYGDWSTALESSAMAVRAAAEVALAATGDIYVAGKFVFRRLARNRGVDWMAMEAWRLAHANVPSDPGATGPWLEILRQRLLFANAVVSFCLTRGWQGPITSIAIEDLASWTPCSTRSGRWRSAFFGMLRFSDGIGLSGPVEAFGADEFSARVWSLLDGRCREDVACRLAQETGRSQKESLQTVDRAVRDLDQAGLLEPLPQ